MRNQAEVDRYWDALTAGGGEPIMGGWLEGRYGLRWQIVRRAFFDTMRDKNPDKSKPVMEAIVQMVRPLRGARIAPWPTIRKPGPRVERPRTR